MKTMKRLLLILIGVFLVNTLWSQTSNTFKYEIKALGGVTIGPTATAAKATITSAILSGTTVSLYNGTTQYSVGVAPADQEDASLIFGKLLPDSVQHTSNFTLALTDANKDLYCVKGTSIVITIPANASVAVPIGTTFNFYGEGAGIMVFKAAANVHLHSDKDSIATSRIHQVVGLKKRGLNYWILYGNLID